MDSFTAGTVEFIDGGAAHLTSSDVGRDLNVLHDDLDRVLSSDEFALFDIKHIDLPDAAMTAATADAVHISNGDASLNATQQIIALPPSQQEDRADLLTLKLDRMSTGDSKDWIKDYGFINSAPLNPSMLDVPVPARLQAYPTLAKMEDDTQQIIALPSSQLEGRANLLPLMLDRMSTCESKDWIKDFSVPPQFRPATDIFEEYEVPLKPLDDEHQSQMIPPLPPLPPLQSSSDVVNDIQSNPPSRITSSTTKKPKSSVKRGKPLNKKPTKKKRRKPRILDMTQVAEPEPNDVLFGRGPSVAQHPGNIRFRRKAESLNEWYQTSVKEEKQRISQILVESVKGDGYRFLEKGTEDKLWHEVISGEHTKASQTFRDLPKNSSMD